MAVHDLGGGQSAQDRRARLLELRARHPRGGRDLRLGGGARRAHALQLGGDRAGARGAVLGIFFEQAVYEIRQGRGIFRRNVDSDGGTWFKIRRMVSGRSSPRKGALPVSS